MRVVIDPATQLRYLSTDEYQFRKHILRLVNFLNRKKCTSFLLFEPTELERETSVALAVDGIIRLRRDMSPGRAIDLRSVQIEKLRGSDFISGLHPMKISGEGIIVFPHLVMKPDHFELAGKSIQTGIPQMDLLLEGGIEKGTATIISGPTGVGKTTLGMQFVVNSIASGEKGIVYTFEEPVEFILNRSRTLGMPVDEMIEAESLKILQIGPMELYPDEFFSTIRNDVEHGKFTVIMIDSIRGYSLAMEQFGTLPAHLQNVIGYLNKCQVTSFLINEVENITGDLKLTEIGISYLVDNAILLRYAEVDGKIIRVVSCLKKRLGKFQPEIREIKITPGGIKVGEKLEGLQGVLSGIPRRLTG